MALILNSAQIVVSLIVIGLILLQDRSSEAGGLFGGGEGGGVYQTRRGLEKVVFGATIVGVIVFTALALTHFLI